MKPGEAWWRLLAPLGVGVLGLVAWGAIAGWMEAQRMREGLDAAGAEAVRRAILPTLSEIWAVALLDRGMLARAAANTFLAALGGFLLAGVGGYWIALALSFSRLMKAAFYPWVLIVQMTPLVVIAPIIALWVRQPPMGSVLLVTFLIGFFPVVANTLHGFASVPKRLEELLLVCRARPWQTFLYLRLPHSLPTWFTGLKIAGTLSPVGAIFADLFVGSVDRAPGLGFLILSYKNTLNTPGLFAAAFVACLMGFTFVGLVRLLRFLGLRRWTESGQSSEA